MGQLHQQQRSNPRVGTSSLELVVPQASTDVGQALLQRTIAVAPKRIRLSFALRVAAVVDRELQIVGVEVNSPERRLYFLIVGGSLYLAEQQYAPAVFSSAAVSGVEPAMWHQVDLVYDVATREALVTFDAEPRVDRQTMLDFTTSELNLFIGTSFTRAGVAADVSFDDFRFVPEL